MGNCLKGVASDDISLLRGNEGVSADAMNIVPPPPLFRDRAPLYYPAPNDGRPANQLSEEEQIKIARRIGLMDHLPVLAYDENVKNKECVICMVEFKVGEKVRYLPCVHVYHVSCIDDWLMRSFTCPSCMEPVDAALLTSYDTTSGAAAAATVAVSVSTTTTTTSAAIVTTMTMTNVTSPGISTNTTTTDSA